jgi:uncharacterized membrane protein YdjX (TVP38/TMEM64 family)
MTGAPNQTDHAARPRGLRRFIPLALILFAALVFIAVGGPSYLSLETVRANYAALKDFVAANFWAAIVLFGAAYAAVAALPIPGATIMSLAAGLLFGSLRGTGLVMIAATIGATIIFLAARTAFADVLRSRTAGFLQKMEAGFSANAFSYLLFLRLVPLFPFFIVNIVPAFTRIRTATFIAATLIGIAPGAFAYVSAGNGLGVVFERGGEIELKGLLLAPEILTPIVALSLLAMLPILLRIFGKTRSPS